MKIKYAILNIMVAGMVLLAASCQKQDHAYKEFIKDGERIYIGKVIDLTAQAGAGRVQLSWGIFDARVKKVKIKYNDNQDSVILDVVKTESIDYVQTIITNLEERTYTFQVYAMDGVGNQSIAGTIDCKSFGESYRKTLNNRIIGSKIISGKNVTLNWVSVTTDSNIAETEIEYYDLDSGLANTVVLAKSSTSIVLPNINTTKGIRYKTKYYPTTNAIDYFFTDYSTYTF